MLCEGSIASGAAGSYPLETPPDRLRRNREIHDEGPGSGR
jgi:hypothetical protein